MSQFKEFCEILCKNDEKRLESLKTILGYLLHRNRERGEDRVVILYDEKMRENLLANGGTGKTLLAKALSYCRETVLFDGKNVKKGSWFKNQRIELSTEILVYDDLSKDISLEEFFNMTTTGIEVEKKRKQSFMIDYDKMPKILMSSNYYIKGPGGSSDARRRLEFEVANFFDDKSRPEDYFGNRFFGRDWDDNEWSRFYYFMMSCVKDYFQYGLMVPEGINLIKSKNLTDTTENFTEFADSYFELDSWLDKRKMLKDYNDYFDEKITSHQFTKWVKTYSGNKNLEFQDKSSNSSTSQVYIGSTTDTLKQRQLDHTERANRTETGKFYEAISTYGQGDFKWEVIDTANSVDELAQKEKHYIIEYEAYQNGYNSDSGGGFKKSVYQYDLKTGLKMTKFECLEDAAHAVSSTKSNISSACLGTSKTAKGFYWSYEDYDYFTRDDNRTTSIKQINKQGEEVNSFKSIAEASRVTGINKSSIAKVIRGEYKTAGGFYWSS